MKLRASVTVIWLTFFLVGIAAQETRKESLLVRRRLTKSSKGKAGSKGKKHTKSMGHKSKSKAIKSNGSKSKGSSGDKSGGKSKVETRKSKASDSSGSKSKGSSGDMSKGKSKGEKSTSKGSESSGSKSKGSSGDKSEGKPKGDKSKGMEGKGSSGSKGGGKGQSESRSKGSSGSKNKGKGESKSESKGCGKGGGQGKGGISVVHEGEKCGEDINGGCYSNPPVYGNIELGQTLLGEYGSVWDPSMGFYKQDADWFLFDVDKSGTCVQAMLKSVDPGIVIFFKGGTWEAISCSENLTDVASGDSTGIPAVYCFSDAGEYGVFIAPEFENASPCKGDPNAYVLALEQLQCGTCLINNSSLGCSDIECQNTVCEIDGPCCDDVWDASCVDKARMWCECAGGERPKIVEEGEPCGEDNNGGCYSNPLVYGSIELGQILLGEYGSVWDPSTGFYKQDTDWFLFDVEKPGTCIQATLNSVGHGIVILFEGGTWEGNSCSENLTDVASGDSTGIPAIYCFPDAGEYGVFVAPEFEDETPCEDDPNAYILMLEYLACGTCHIEHESPGCYDKKCEKTVCEIDVSCCNDAWNASCVVKATRWCDCTVVDKPGCDDAGKGKGKGGSGKKDKESKSKKKSSKESNAKSGKKGSGKGTGGK
jgi:hypothetical protein